VRRYLRVYRSFAASSFQRELEFKANFFAKIGQNVLWLGFFALTLLIVFSRTTSVAGWTKGESLVLAATVFLMGAISTGFFFSLTEIPQQVRMGTLDFVLVRPVDPQFWVSLRRLAPEQAGVALVGFGMVVLGLRIEHLAPSLAQWAGWSLLVACAVAIFYSLNLALMTTAVWFVRVDNLFVLTETVQQVARFPTDIYGAVMARFLTFAIPLGILGTLPARALVRGLPAWALLAGLAWAVAALVLSRLFWFRALRSYGSASG
jgi:ABC-2 type transport system permease protein